MEKKKLDTKQIRTGSDPLSQIKIKHQIASSQSVEKTIAKNPEAFPILKVGVHLFYYPSSSPYSLLFFHHYFFSTF